MDIAFKEYNDRKKSTVSDIRSNLNKRSRSIFDQNVLRYDSILKHQYMILENMKSNALESIRSDQKTQIMASMLPDEILSHEINYQPRKFDTVLFFADVSGFTDLSDKFSQLGKGSASKLSYVLNTYIGNMIQEVLSHGGDILKFSGDAFLVEFKRTSVTSMQDAAHEAIDTAIIIQKNYGVYTTDVGVVLKVKIAISAGEVHFSLIGTEEMSYYIIIGPPLWEVKKAECLCSAGDVIVVHSAWQYISRIDYIWKRLDDNIHYKIFGFSEVWRSIQHVTSSINLMDNLLDCNSGKTYSHESNRSLIKALPISKDSLKELFQLRPIIDFVLKKNIKHLLPRFLIAPLFKAIESNEPIDYLTEMRQVVTVFINIVTKKISLLELIESADTAFKHICAIVNFHEGIVNKVSLFDKDLMFLCVFGLRGYKHQLESQIALRCASEAFKVLSQVPNVATVSIGVTTGLTYCGVIGHTLRREYSVISISVNRAARLMMSYINQVTCDSDTFLTSKMESKHFTLQPFRELKGLHSVGPVYLFQELIEHPDVNIPQVATNSLIGRDDVIQNILSLLQRAHKSYLYLASGKSLAIDEKTCVILLGETQIGKTRIINELFILAAGRGYNCLNFKLHVTQRRKPYSTILLILSRTIKIDEKSTPNEKQIIIGELLKDYNISEYMYALNLIFDVSFNYPKKPLEGAKLIATQKKIIKLLFQIVFKDFYILFLDDFEYTDEESLTILRDAFFESFDVFCIITISERAKDSHFLIDIWKNKFVDIIKIKPVDQIYQCRIACQFLKVKAIPLDLERVLHTRSNGNSGWIDSFLISLIQSSILKITNMTEAQALAKGLVYYDSLADNKDPTLTIDVNDWNMFSITFKDSNMEQSISNESFMKKSIGAYTNNKTIPVAILTDFYLVEEHENELTIDSLNVIVFDSLSAFEQMICKCAAVLGDTILRSMLIYVMSAANEYEIAKGIQTLFELHVLVCSAGDFSGGAKIFHRNVKIDGFYEPRCICVGIYISEEFKNLPAYALCGYMRFRVPQFTETVYNLLTEKQRVDFHQRALIYLENETRRCTACGGGYFTDVLMTDTRMSAAYNKEAQRFNDELLGISSTSSLLLNKQKLKTTTCSSFKILTKHPKTQPNIISYKEYNFTQCECNMILYAMYNMIIHHCNGAFLYRKIIDAQIEFAYVCILIQNLPRALNLLNDALSGLEKLSNKYLNNNFDDEFLPYLYGRIYTLQGECHYKIKQIDKATEYFYKASAIMGIEFPKTKNISKCSITRILQRIKRELKINDEQKNNSNYSDLKILITQQLSDCFSAMFLLFFDENMWQLAYLAAVRSLEQALNCHRNFYSIAIGFSNVLLITYHIGKTKYWLLEKAMQLVPSFNNVIDVKCLNAVIRMYRSILLCQLSSNDKNTAIELCYIIINIANAIQMPSYKWNVIPILVDFLIGLYRIEEVAEILQRIKTVARKYASTLGTTWYYALCLDVQLDTGYTIVHYYICEKFYFDRFDTLDINNDRIALARFFTNLWLWCVRNEFWETADMWLTKIHKYLKIKRQDPWINTFTGIRFLEGLLIMLVSSIESRNVASIIELEKQIKSLFKNIDKSFRLANVYICTFKVMAIYFKQIKRFRLSHIKKLRKTKQLCAMRQSYARYEIMCHTEKCWRKQLTPIEHNFWIDHCARNNIYYWQAFKKDGTYHPYSFPLPKSGFL